MTNRRQEKWGPGRVRRLEKLGQVISGQLSNILTKKLGFQCKMHLDLLPIRLRPYVHQALCLYLSFCCQTLCLQTSYPSTSLTTYTTVSLELKVGVQQYNLLITLWRDISPTKYFFGLTFAFHKFHFSQLNEYFQVENHLPKCASRCPKIPLLKAINIRKKLITLFHLDNQVKATLMPERWNIKSTHLITLFTRFKTNTKSIGTYRVVRCVL